MATAYHMVQHRRFDTSAVDLVDATLEGLCRSALYVLDGSGVTLWKRGQDRLATTPKSVDVINALSDTRQRIPANRE
jgi:hypothetical protein